MSKFHWKYLILGFLLICLSYSFYQSYHHTKNTFGTDLRNRVVGARVYNLNQDPYFFKWDKEQSKELLDPYQDPRRKSSRLTITPFLLQIHSLFANFSYPTWRYTWLILQYLLLIGCIILLMKLFPKNLLWPILIVGIFVLSPPWLFHVERGQVYILYTFLILLLIYFKDNNIFVFSTLLAFLILFRPTFVLLLLYPLLNDYKKFSQTILITCSIVLIHLSFNTDLYFSYLNSLKVHENFNLFNFLPDQYYLNFSEIENLNNVQSIGVFRVNNSSLQFLIWEYFKLSVPTWIYYLIGFLFLSITTYLFVKKKNIGFYKLIAMVIILEMIMPAPRLSYNLVLCLPCIAYISNANHLKPLIFLVIALIFLHLGFPTENLTVAELIIVLLCFLNYEKIPSTN